MSVRVRLITYLFIINHEFILTICGTIPPVPKIKIYKCCQPYELYHETRCVNVTELKTTQWKPIFTDAQGKSNVQVPYKLIIGRPQCGSRQAFPIIYHAGSSDKLRLLPDGRLRHYFLQRPDASNTDLALTQDEHTIDDTNNKENQRYYDYQPGAYCIDKATLPTHERGPLTITDESEYAIVCNPDVTVPWHNGDFILRRIVDPTFHGISLACYLAVAIIHFVMQQLRNLVGNMLTSMCLCFAVAQIADTVKIFTEFTSPTTFLIADCVLYVSILSAFFWLNSLGYYIWKKFRSRNIFLRTTDGRKYCYYSFYVWGSTLGMAMLAVFAHFTLDADMSVPNKAPSPIEQGALGWLGVAVFFTPIAFTILVDIFFYATTVKTMDRMSTYGRIHHKLKYSFKMYIRILVLLTICWLLMLISWLPHHAMYYVYIFSNFMQAILLLYVTVLSQKRVRFLIGKACCYEKCIIPCFRPDEQEVQPEWGEEMMSMNRPDWR